MEIFIQMMRHPLKYLGFKFHLNPQTVWTQEEITYFAIAYTLLCKINYGYHN